MTWSQTLPSRVFLLKVELALDNLRILTPLTLGCLKCKKEANDEDLIIKDSLKLLLTTITTSEKLQDTIDKIPTIREYVWDTSPYEPVAGWEELALTAVKEAFGKNSGEAAELSDVIEDEQWKNINRPDSVPPEVFVNKDFQRRIDNIEKMLKGYMKSLSTRKQARSHLTS